MATSSTRAWRRWLLALMLCGFAFSYGAPTEMAHAVTAGVVASDDCLSSAGHEPRSGHDVSSPCCIAHCVPAVPPALPVLPLQCAVPVEIMKQAEERGEGRALAVPLPPPRDTDCA